MSFGEHLEELRTRIIRSIAAVVVCFVVCLLFKQTIMNVLSQPLLEVLREIERKAVETANPLAEAEAKLEALGEVVSGQPPSPTRNALEGILATERLVLDKLKGLLGPRGEIIVMRPQELFVTYLKVCAICALFLASPYVIYQAWAFIGTGLYSHERRYIHVFGPVTGGCFIVGSSFAYFAAVRFGVRFLLTFGSMPYISNKIAIGQWVFFLMVICLVMGLVFELPLVMLFLNKIGVVSTEQFASKRRYAILSIFVLAALLTPPDPVTQLLMALPMLGLYEAGILLTRIQR